jgi:DNA-binding response OmpR family regulator
LARIVFLTDRSPAEVLPAVESLGFDVKTEPLAEDSLAHLAHLAPSAVFVDAVAGADAAFRLLRAIAVRRTRAPVMAVLSLRDLEEHPWYEVADGFVWSAASPAEVRTRLSMVQRRTGSVGESVLRLGPLSLDPESYQVVVGGRILDLTYKEFELLRFLVEHAGRVFTRGALLQRVWGYDFYGGTRTVDVHVRRLRAKLGAEHEGLIETVRGVGYRAASPGDDGYLTG